MVTIPASIPTDVLTDFDTSRVHPERHSPGRSPGSNGVTRRIMLVCQCFATRRQPGFGHSQQHLHRLASGALLLE